VSQDTEANYVETVNVSLVEQQLNNSSNAVEAAGQLRSNNGSFKVPSEREREVKYLGRNLHRFFSDPVQRKNMAGDVETATRFLQVP